MTEREKEIIDALDEDGATFELSETRRLKLHIRHDESYSINEYESDGKISLGFDHRDRGFRHRPEGFSGRARKIEADRGIIVWWEPYDGPMGWQDESGEWHHGIWEQLPRDKQREEVNRITDLIRYGFSVVGLELQELVTDSHGGTHWVELETEWIGGIEPTQDSLADAILDLTVELSESVTEPVT